MLKLRTLLTVPFVMLVLLPSLTIGGFSLYTGLRAVDHLSRQLITDISQRIERAAVNQLEEAAIILSAAFPSLTEPDATILAAQRDIEALEERLFALTQRSRTASYIYFARADGAFIGIDRSIAGLPSAALLRLQVDPSKPRSLYQINLPRERDGPRDTE